MANLIHYSLLEQGVATWNEWRTKCPESRPDLSDMVLLAHTQLRGIDFSNTNLRDAHLTFCDLTSCDLRGADLSGAYLTAIDLSQSNLDGACLSQAKIERACLQKITALQADFSGAKMSWSDLSYSTFARSLFRGTDLMRTQIRKADLSQCDFTGADLLGSNIVKVSLQKAMLIRTDLQYCNLALSDLRNAQIKDCLAFGCGVWDLEIQDSEQSDIRITLADVTAITVDSLEVAQFIHLLLNNKRIRDVIDTITSKVVLILGRFTKGRKPVLDAIREELRKRNYTPVMFDFDKPTSRDTVETISTLAHMARFIIADITDAKSVLQELQAIVPHLPSVPVQPVLLSTQQEPGMFDHFSRSESMLKTYMYSDQDTLLASLADKVIGPAEELAKKLTGK